MSEGLIKTPTTFGDNGNFLLERELGTGGMGGVYMGRDKMLDRAVAVKVMLKELGSDVEFVDKFKREAQAAARLIHPNIAQIYSYGICEGMPYIAMELAAGGSLYTIMNATPGKTDVTRVMKIGQQVAQALQCASDLGFVHGDVKPENILLDANGNAKLVDFGLAAMQKDTSEIWGTPYYISPEKVKKEPIDFRADMYSLGGTLYHALTGVAPFEGTDAIAVVKKRFDGMPKKPSEVRAGIPPAIDALIMKMLAFNREDRYPTFEALVQAFKEVLTTGFTEKMPKPSGAARVVPKRMMIRKQNLTAAPMDVNKDEEAPEEEEGANIGRKIALFVGGGILVIGAVVGSLVWFQNADKAKHERANAEAIANGIAKAREAVARNKEITLKNGEEFAEMSRNAVFECEKITKELSGLLPELAASLKPAPTNGVEGVSKPADELPEIVEDVHDLWYHAYDCQASAEAISAEVAKVVAECDKLANITQSNAEALNAMSAISERTKELHGQISASKNAETLRKGAGYISSKGKNLINQTVKKLRIKKLEDERRAKAEEVAAAEKARQEEMAAKKQALIESEQNESAAKFESIVNQGCLRQLDWKSAFRQLETMKSEFKTAEGQIAADLQIHKVDAMKKVQDVFIKVLPKYSFKTSKLKGMKVIAVNENEIKLMKSDENPQTIQWPKFYKDYPSNLNELINAYVVNGRKGASLNLLEWADAMTGAALTMRLICNDVTGAMGRAEWIAQETVKQFPDFAKTAREIFPDITFSAIEE